MSSDNAPTAAFIENFAYSLPRDMEKALQSAHENWDRVESTERLWKRDACLWTNTDEGKRLDGSTLASVQPRKRVWKRKLFRPSRL